MKLKGGKFNWENIHFDSDINSKCKTFARIITISKSLIK